MKTSSSNFYNSKQTSYIDTSMSQSRLGTEKDDSDFKLISEETVFKCAMTRDYRNL